ncbi:hypothetical protein [Nostoc sp. FACHB-888]|uniref:hypothetical protein n=1 Tax=Nostoc sp. FACHB-888 TaxID=2692842 RepID=UPI001F559C92|nr:hypothetical protein [Nostoc sp. FACHB-888]
MQSSTHAQLKLQNAPSNSGGIVLMSPCMFGWLAPRPPFGYAKTNARRIKERILQTNEMTAFLIRINRETGKRGAEKDWALDTSYQIEGQMNWSINNLRADLR